MIKHIVMWKLKKFAEGKCKLENANIIKTSLEDLQKEINQIYRGRHKHEQVHTGI